MRAIVKDTGKERKGKRKGKEIEVYPYYLYGRIVAYITDNVVAGIDLRGKYAYLPDELVDMNGNCLPKG